jgi:hypothetical protein
MKNVLLSLLLFFVIMLIQCNSCCDKPGFQGEAFFEIVDKFGIGLIARRGSRYESDSIQILAIDGKLLDKNRWEVESSGLIRITFLEENQYNTYNQQFTTRLLIRYPAVGMSVPVSVDTITIEHERIKLGKKDCYGEALTVFNVYYNGVLNYNEKGISFWIQLKKLK